MGEAGMRQVMYGFLFAAGAEVVGKGAQVVSQSRGTATATGGRTGRPTIGSPKPPPAVTHSAPKPVGRPTTTVLSDVTVISRGKVVGRGNAYLRPTIEGIESGRISPRGIFENRPLPGKTTPELPVKPPGYYEEFVHPTPGVSGAGSQRIVRGAGGELYYTPDHYATFIPLN
jgi:hypothetical protein